MYNNDKIHTYYIHEVYACRIYPKIEMIMNGKADFHS
jgi:hypothetical protein